MNHPPTTWRTVRRTLRTLTPPATARVADEFWRDFQARRALHPPHPVLVRERRLSPFLRPALATAGVAILLIGGLLLVRGRGLYGPGAVRADRGDGQYAAAMLLTDESAQVTIPGISGMEMEDEEGDI